MMIAGKRSVCPSISPSSRDIRQIIFAYRQHIHDLPIIIIQALKSLSKTVVSSLLAHTCTFTLAALGVTPPGKKPFYPFTLDNSGC
jgi:hypothetical protein